MTIQSFISGKWEGYFFDSRAFEGMPPNSKWNMDIEMSFENNDNFTATGSDDVGPFVFEGGEITGGKVRFLKAYATHNVVYEGEIKGTKMEGHWWLETHPDCKGDWAIWPATAQS